jgi:septation ring formation regulator EzrA
MNYCKHTFILLAVRIWNLICVGFTSVSFLILLRFKMFINSLKEWASLLGTKWAKRPSFQMPNTYKQVNVTGNWTPRRRQSWNQKWLDSGVTKFPAILNQIFCTELHNTLGFAVAQADSRRSLTTEAQVRVRVSLYEICGGQSGTGMDFSPSSSVTPSISFNRNSSYS